MSRDRRRPWLRFRGTGFHILWDKGLLTLWDAPLCWATRFVFLQHCVADSSATRTCPSRAHMARVESPLLGRNLAWLLRIKKESYKKLRWIWEEKMWWQPQLTPFCCTTVGNLAPLLSHNWLKSNSFQDLKERKRKNLSDVREHFSWLWKVKLVQNKCSGELGLYLLGEKIKGKKEETLDSGSKHKFTTKKKKTREDVGGGKRTYWGMARTSMIYWADK